jgi:hypothetical protein
MSEEPVEPVETEEETDYFAKCQEFINDDSFLEKMRNPEEIKNRIKTLEEQSPYILAEFKKNFILYNKNPEYSEYQQMFQNIKSNLGKIGAQFFELLNTIQVDTEELNKKLNCLNALIVEERQKNRRLKRRLGIVDNENNASNEMIYDFNKMYEEGYLRNWGLVISILAVFLIIKNMSSNTTGDVQSNLKNMSEQAKTVGTDIYNKGVSRVK